MVISFTSIATAITALVAVLTLIGLAGRVERVGGIAQRSTGGHSLTVADVLVLDARRRLHLVKYDRQRGLLLTGGAPDIVVG